MISMLDGRMARVAGLIVSVLVAGSSLSYAAQTNVELLIDDSGSMAQRVEGGRKIDVARQVLSGLVPDLPADAQIAIRTYGRQKASRERDCADMELLTPFGPNSSQRILPAVRALKPNGMTPIAASLQEAVKDFAGKEGQNNIIVLLSDGEEDCNGDPCAAAKAVHDAGIHLQVNVIGFHVGAAGRKQLECVARDGGGKYYDAAGASELKLAATEVKEKIASSPAAPPASPTSTPTPYVKAAESLYGDPIHGGDSYDGAVTMPTGKLFHLDHPQPTKKQDFFSLQVKGGQTIVATITSGASSSVGAVISDSKRNSLQSTDVDPARRVSVIKADVADQQDGTYYILIGSQYNAQGPDSTFQVDLVNNYDANSDRDAGTDESRALEVPPGTYMHNYMSDVDQMDVFKFKAEAGKSYQFKVRPSSANATLQLQAVDSDGVQLGNGQSVNRGAVAKIENLKIPKAGYIFVKVSYDHYADKGPYSMAFGPGDVDSPPPPPKP